MRMRFKKLYKDLGLAITASALVSCTPPNGATTGADNTFVLRGSIDRAAYEEFRRFRSRAPDEPFKLVVTSAGGDARIGLLFGEEIKRSNAELEVVIRCVSACAQYLMPAASRITLSPGAFVGLHTGPSDLILPDDAPKLAKAQQSNIIGWQNEFYESIGMDHDLMAQVSWMVMPVCRSVGTNNFGDLRDYGLYSKYTVVVPSLPLMRRMNYPEIVGDWPESLNDARERAINAGYNDRFTVNYVESLRDYRRDGLPLCRFIEV